MPNPRLAFRYAKALLDLAVEKEQLDEVYTDMLWLKSVCKSNPDFVNMLKSPVVPGDKKNKILKAIAGDRLGKMVTSFNSLLIQKAREASLPEIVNAFIVQYKEYKNIYIIKLTTAGSMDKGLKEAIVKQVKLIGGFENIELEEKIDNAIVGGFVLQVGDKLIDASIAYDLKTIAKQFENNDFLYKLR
ncbi:MAG: ATP synthase F1 subunit delta [Bacteroidia bacterium]|nr:ATP synthase F1 subunit delta [Bacteroidia bacterium]